MSYWLFEESSPAMEGRLAEMVKRRLTATDKLADWSQRVYRYSANSIQARVEPHIRDDLQRMPPDEFWKKYFTNPKIIDEAYEYIDWGDDWGDIDEDTIDETPTEINWARGREGELICQKILREKKDFYFKPSVVKELGKPSKIVRFGEFSVLSADDLRQIWIPLETEVAAVFVADSDLLDRKFDRVEMTQLKIFTQWSGAFDAARAGIVPSTTAMEVNLNALSTTFEESLQRLYEYDKKALEIGRRPTHTSDDLDVLNNAVRASDACIKALQKSRNTADKFVNFLRTRVANAAPFVGAAGGWKLGTMVKSEKEPNLPILGLLNGLILGAGLWANMTDKPRIGNNSAASLQLDLNRAIENGCDAKTSRELLGNIITFMEEARGQYLDLRELIRRELAGSAPAFHFD